MRIIKLIVLCWALKCTIAPAMEVTLMARRLTPVLVTPICQVQYIVGETDDLSAHPEGSRLISPIALPCDLESSTESLQEIYQQNKHCVQRAMLEPLDHLIPSTPRALSMAVSTNYPQCHTGGMPSIAMIDRHTVINLPELIPEVTIINEGTEPDSIQQIIYAPVDLIAALYHQLIEDDTNPIKFEQNQPVYLPFYASATPLEIETLQRIDNPDDNTQIIFNIHLLSHPINIPGH